MEVSRGTAHFWNNDFDLEQGHLAELLLRAETFHFLCPLYPHLISTDGGVTCVSLFLLTHFPSFFKFLFVCLAVLGLLCGTRDLELWHVNSLLWHVGASSPTRDQIPGLLCWELGVLATGPPGKSPFPSILQL